MKLSKEGLRELKNYEGCRLAAYQDKGGSWTIGYGDTHNVSPGMVITQVEADTRLAKRAAEFEAVVFETLHHVPTQGQFDALVSLCYNVGEHAFSQSTLVRLYNDGQALACAREFGKWVYVKGVVDSVLCRRRVSEVVRFFQP